MKYHKHLLDSVADCLFEIFANDRHADKAISYNFKKHRRWGKRDRQFFAETVYDSVRWWRKYQTLCGLESVDSIEDIHRILAVHFQVNDLPLPDWYDEYVVPADRLDQRLSPAETAAYPDWLYELCEQEMGAAWHEAATHLNKQARVVLRANELKNTAQELQSLLVDQNIEAEVIDTEKYPQALVLTKRANVFATEAFKQGRFEVQDASSQLVSLMLAPKPGERVIDACAGAGGKTLHLSSLMKNKGRVVAMDIHQWKLDELKTRAKRSGASVVETKLISSNKVIKRLAESADALLLDVPCTGLGVLKRNPDTKWKLTPERHQELLEIQAELLSKYSAMVKPGGRMVYSTCSILPSENGRQVDVFLEKNSAWSLEIKKTVLPDEKSFDGFFMALMKRR